MVSHSRLPSLESVPPARRSITAAALRRGEIKISEPVPLENSGPSPVWNSSPDYAGGVGPNGLPLPTTMPAAAIGMAHSPNPLLGQHLHHMADSVTGFGTSTDQFQMMLPEHAADAPRSSTSHINSVHEQGSSDGLGSGVGAATASGLAQYKTHKRTSTYMSVSKEALAQEQAMMAQRRTSTNESSSIDVNSPTKKKRRSGSIRMAFKRMFSKKEKESPRRASPQRASTNRGPSAPKHEYHSSVSLITSAQLGPTLTFWPRNPQQLELL